MIKSLYLKNFTGFKEIDIKLSPRINIIIGKNGTGKTHLLKAAYVMASDTGISKESATVDTDTAMQVLTRKFVDVFKPLDNKLWKLKKTGEAERAIVRIQYTNDRELSVTFNTNSQTVTFPKNNLPIMNEIDISITPVFIPTKEVLSFMKGFPSLYHKYNLSFDQTYLDVCNLLDLPDRRAEQIPEKSKWAMIEIEKICGGRFVFQGGGNVIFTTKSDEYSVNVTAEGFRKLGMLYRLLETGAISPGINGPLFWDEPDANLNPQLLKMLAQVLLELARNGQQIIIATHNYVLLKWFDLLQDPSKEDHVKYHALYLDDGEIKIESNDDYNLINNNAIDSTYGDLINSEIENEMGDLGK